jgi:hypothetical protein
MRHKFIPALVLILLATILPEMLSGNTPARELFSPGPFLFLIAAYGLPVLLIREFSVRHSIGLAGVFLAGLGYGLINEALLAKTVFRDTGVPVDVYDGYGFAFGIQWAWTAFILPWHAVASVLLPICFANMVTPAAAARPWLGIGTALGLAVVIFALITFFHIAEDRSGIPGTMLSAAVLWGAIAALVILARMFPIHDVRASAGLAAWKLWLLGFSGIIPTLALLAIAGVRLPLFLYFAATFAWVGLYGWMTRDFADPGHPAFGWFGLGWYMQIGIFSWLAIAARLPYMVAADAAAFALLFAIVRRRKALMS